MPVPAPRRVKPGKHAAPLVRPQLLPGLLLVSAGAAFAGLAALPSNTVGSPLAAGAQTDTLAVGGPDLFSDLVVSLKPPLPTPVVQSKIAAKAQADAAAAAAAKAQAAKAAKAAATAAAVKKGKAATLARSTAALASTEGRASRSAPRVSRAGAARPCSGTLTSSYGQRWGRLHAGLDFGAPTGTPIRAVLAGVVKEIKYTRGSGGYGNLTILEHADGTLTYYGHQSKFLVSEGDTVSAGETIGLVGSTGNSTGPHLHFEVHPGGGGAINPRPWLRERGVSV